MYFQDETAHVAPNLFVYGQTICVASAAPSAPGEIRVYGLDTKRSGLVVDQSPSLRPPCFVTVTSTNPGSLDTGPIHSRVLPLREALGKGCIFRVPDLNFREILGASGGLVVSNAEMKLEKLSVNLGKVEAQASIGLTLCIQGQIENKAVEVREKFDFRRKFLFSQRITNHEPSYRVDKIVDQQGRRLLVSSCLRMDGKVHWDPLTLGASAVIKEPGHFDEIVSHLGL